MNIVVDINVIIIIFMALAGNKILQRPKEKLAVYKYLGCNLLILLSGSARLSDYKSISIG